jgi:hypothetical protein
MKGEPTRQGLSDSPIARGDERGELARLLGVGGEGGDAAHGCAEGSAQRQTTRGAAAVMACLRG